MKLPVILLVLCCLLLTGQSAPALFSSCSVCAVNTQINLRGSGYPPNMTGNSHVALSITAYCGANPNFKNPQTIFYYLAHTDASGNFDGTTYNSPGGTQPTPVIFPSYISGMSCDVYASVPSKQGGNTVWTNVAEVELDVQ